MSEPAKGRNWLMLLHVACHGLLASNDVAAARAPLP
jgi:hypothetical protein